MGTRLYRVVYVSDMDALSDCEWCDHILSEDMLPDALSIKKARYVGELPEGYDIQPVDIDEFDEGEDFDIYETDLEDTPIKLVPKEKP